MKKYERQRQRQRGLDWRKNEEKSHKKWKKSFRMKNQEKKVLIV